MPIYTDFLSKIRGIGPAMGAVIAAEITISRVKYPSHMLRWCGYDVVQVSKPLFEIVDEESGEIKVLQNVMLDLNIQPKQIELLNKDLKGRVIGELLPTMNVESLHNLINALENISVTKFKKSINVSALLVDPENTDIVEDSCTPLEYLRSLLYDVNTGKPQSTKIGEGRSNKKDHLVQRNYTDSEGEQKTKMSIAYNPFLKTKLYLVSLSFLKAGNARYEPLYRQYRTRLDQHVKYANASKKHKHFMALRFMMKIFLYDLYDYWRKQEGLEAYPTYEAAKLGIVHNAPSDVKIGQNPLQAIIDNDVKRPLGLDVADESKELEESDNVDDDE